jgi:hypothetical protein
LEIAQLAAQGLTNKQIGQRLFLSHRTVATHLYQLYPKLGISSRAALSDALATIAPQPEAAAPPDELPRQLAATLQSNDVSGSVDLPNDTAQDRP